MYRFLTCALVAAVFTAGDSSELAAKKMLIIGHRGASHRAPENTVASVLLAFKEKADIAEIDVRLSKDNRMMVIHDKTTKRTTGVDLTVSQTDSGQLRKLDAGSFKSKKYAGEKIPFLEEVMAVVPGNKKLFIEVKCGPEIVPSLKKAIDAGGKMDCMTIISFDFEVLVECRKVMPAVPSYYLCSTEKDKQTGEYPPYDEALIQKTADAGLTGLNLSFHGLTRDFVQKAHRAGLKVYVWTVDDTGDAERMRQYGIDGITTNKPGQMRTELNL